MLLRIPWLIFLRLRATPATRWGSQAQLFRPESPAKCSSTFNQKTYNATVLVLLSSLREKKKQHNTNLQFINPIEE
jgi:hypothetical protein